MYGNAGLGVAVGGVAGGGGRGGGGGGGGRRNSSPETEETEMSGDELHRTSFTTGAFNPLMVVQGQGGLQLELFRYQERLYEHLFPPQVNALACISTSEMRTPH